VLGGGAKKIFDGFADVTPGYAGTEVEVKIFVE